MYCTKCGFKNETNNKYCYKCGKKLKVKPNYIKDKIFIGFAIFFLLGVCFSEDIQSALFFGIISIIFFILSRKYIKYVFFNKDDSELIKFYANKVADLEKTLDNELTKKTEVFNKEYIFLKEKKENLDKEITILTQKNEQLLNDLKSITNVIEDKKQLNEEIQILFNQKSEIELEKIKLEKEISLLEIEALTSTYNFSDYENINSEDCKNKLLLLKNDEKDLIKMNKAIINNHFADNKVNKNNIKQLLRLFNCECENILLNLTFKNIDASRSKINKSYESLNKIFETDHITISKELLAIKLEELNLIHTYEIQKQNELEQQKAIKQQLIEEEKVRKEIEREKIKLEKEEKQFKTEISKLIEYLHKSDSDIEKQLYVDKIKELEEKLKVVEKDKENVLNREQNTRAGFVYIISNIGSFGENIYKIGMTRRLEPMDRIKELSDASVPFPFDVHALIFSEDAPALENILHQTFKENQLNQINSRKEFFKIDLDKIKDVVKQNHNATVTFINYPEAYEYRESLKLKGSLIN